MNSRFAPVALIAVPLALIAAEIALLQRDHTGDRWHDAGDRVQTSMVDRLVFTDTAAAFATGEMEHVSLIPDDPARIVLDYPQPKWFPREGTWTSRQEIADFPFSELLPSWNLITPDGTGVLFHVRTRDAASQQWAPWLRIGSWGRTTAKTRRDRCDFGHVTEDTLFLDRPADAYQIRATLQSYDFDTTVNPTIRRIAVTYSGPTDENSIWAKSAPAAPIEGWARSLDVPYLPQGDNADPVTGMTCSPTSVSMVLRYWGVMRPTMENCLAIWDDHNDLFGNWSNATQRASELGMDAWLQRFRNWDQVKLLIARGQPIVASIMYEKGTMADSPDPALAEWKTGGHLIVIRGFTSDGNVIVNDPGNRKRGHGVIMSARGLGHAWLGHGGVGYVIRPPAKPLPASLVKAYPATMPTTVPVAAR